MDNLSELAGAIVVEPNLWLISVARRHAPPWVPPFAQGHCHQAKTQLRMRRKIKWCPGVYICICNALTDRRLKQALEEGAGQTPGAVYAACGCRAQCGKCAVAIMRMLREHGPEAQPDLALQGAD